MRKRTAELQAVLTRIVEHLQAALDGAALTEPAQRRALPASTKEPQ